jgi:hypothetical protein
MSAVAISKLIDHVIQGAPGSVEAMHAGLLGPSVVGHLTMDDFPHLAVRLELLVPVFAGAIRNGAVGVNILLHGLPGSSKTQLAMVLAAVLHSRPSCD